MLDSSPLKTSLDEFLEGAGGTPYEIGGNTPFLLNEPDVVWHIVSGTVEVFTVRVEDGQPLGTRYHFFTAKTGDLLFGMDLERIGQGLGFLAVGVVGTRVSRVPLSLIQQTAQYAQFAAELGRRLENWITGLSTGVTKSIYPHPRADRMIEPGDEVDLTDGQKARARRGIVWVQFIEGSSLFIGMEEASMLNAEALFPLSHDTWVQAISSTKLVVSGTSSAILQRGCWDGLESFYEVLFKCEFFNTTLSAVDEYNRLKKKADRDQIARQESLEQLAAVMTHAERPEAVYETEDPLFAACAAIGKVEGIRFVAPPRLKEEQWRKDPLGDIVKVSRLRMRPVILSDNWWKKDNGALLAFVQPDNKPVALLPLSPTSYQLFDPAKRTTHIVTKENAQSLSETAFMFYRPFPDRPITFRDLVTFGFKGTSRDVWTILLMGLFGGLLSLVTPLVTGVIFDSAVPEAERGQLFQLCLALLVSAVASTLFILTQAVAVLRVEGKFDNSVNSAIMDRLLSLPVPFFRQFSAGDLASRSSGITEIRRILTGQILLSIVSSSFSLISFILLFYYDSKLALVATGITAVVILITSLAGYLQLKYQRQVRDLEGKIAGIVFQLITGISKLRVAGVEGHAFAYWAKEFAKQKKVAFRARSISNYLLIFNGVLPLLATTIVFASMAFFTQSSLSTGSFLAFNSAFTQFLMAAMMLSSMAVTIQGLVPIYERGRPILQSLPEVDEAKAHPGELSGEIELSHVSFRYEAEGPLILKDCSIHIRPGEFVAVVGPSGTGKSTLFRLLLGFEKPERGSIHYDGQDVSVLDIQAVRRQIGVVLQQSKLMSGDIFHNIIGTSTLTMEDAWEAARKAGIDEDIKLMPMGMHTVISEGAATFSGGQRQRLLIARAIALRPRILLFDEATSALDNRTQAVVSESLEKLQATRVVIAHRLSTIMNADRILVFDQGRIVQTGTYSELMNQPGLFLELAERQLA